MVISTEMKSFVSLLNFVQYSSGSDCAHSFKLALTSSSADFNITQTQLINPEQHSQPDSYY